ncbi:ATP-dependent DNA helicase [Trichonephila clavipes]|nr:ATP-dependent DNA helicase [Trichonephila clavipes]
MPWPKRSRVAVRINISNGPQSNQLLITDNTDFGRDPELFGCYGNDSPNIPKDCKVALNVSSSGIAATLLSGGWTAHSVFKLPINLASEETSTCNSSKNSALGALLKHCKTIVWDECTMSHKRAIEAFDSCLQDFKNYRKLMGGVVVLLAGDFTQTLPVIEKATASDEISACLKASFVWTKVEKLFFTINMRVQLWSYVE